MTDRPLDWHVAVYCADEAARLQACLDSVLAALAGCRALVTVILNGSRDDSAAIARRVIGAGVPVELIRIAAADKSNAINQFCHVLRRPAANCAGVDGYAVVGRDSFRAMAGRLAADPHANAVSGIATNGRTSGDATAETLSVGGRLHGQLHALRSDFVDRLVGRGLRLPIGLYRGDGLLGSMAAHDLDPLRNAWDSSRIPGVAGATYDIPVLSPFRPSDLRRQLRRQVRQARGQMENAAIKAIIYRDGYEALPATADEMISRYVAEHGAPEAGLTGRLFQRRALREVAQARPIAPDALAPLREAGA